MMEPYSPRAAPSALGLVATRADTADDVARVFRGVEPVASDWQRAATEGGLPPAVFLDPADRGRWFDGYVATYLERDLQQLSAISDLGDFRRLLRLAAHRIGGLLNRAELARDAGLSRPTAHRWVNLLEVSFQVRLLPVCAEPDEAVGGVPKRHFRDTGLGAHLVGVSTEAGVGELLGAGAWLENLVLVDLDAWRETVSPRPEVLFWRTAEGAEVQLVTPRVVAAEAETVEVFRF